MQLISPKPKISILSELERVIIRDLWEETTEEPHRRFWCLPPTQWLKQLSKNVNFLFSQRGQLNLYLRLPSVLTLPSPTDTPGQSPHTHLQSCTSPSWNRRQCWFSKNSVKSEIKATTHRRQIALRCNREPQLPSSCSFPTLSDQKCRMNLDSVYK